MNGAQASSLRVETVSRTMVQERLRVRLLIAIPVMFVLLLSTMGGVLYQFADSLFQYSEIEQKRLAQFAQFWLGVMVVFDALGAGVGLYLAHSITSPIRAIINISEKVAGGDFSGKAEITSGDEVEQLGHCFNLMVESLNKSITMRNQFVLESFTGGLVTTDVNGTVTAMNSAGARMLGIEETMAVGKPVSEVFSRPGLEPFLALVEEALWKHEPIVSRKLMVHPFSSSLPISANCSTMYDPKGGAFGVIVNFRDLGALERFYEQMHREDRLATIGTFASGLAHEVRNPLGAIKGTAQLLAEDVKSNPRAAEYTQVIVKEVNRLDVLVREVQEFSRPSLAAKTPTDLNRVVAETLQLARNNPKAALREAVEIKESYGALPQTLASRDKIVQALLNIVLNAFQATPEGERIEISTEYAEHEPLPLRIQVRNSGSSVSPEQMGRIFEPFFTTKDNGTGLGLSIAYQIITHHGGEIRVKSMDNEVTFSIGLPLLNAAEEG